MLSFFAEMGDLILNLQGNARDSEEPKSYQKGRKLKDSHFLIKNLRQSYSNQGNGIRINA